MEIVVNILGIFFSGYWLWLSIPTCIFVLFYTIHLLIIGYRKRKMKTWKVGDIVYIKHDSGGNVYNEVYLKAKSTSPVNQACVKLLKWNKYESLVELGNGDEYFIETRKIDNRVADYRVRKSKMDEFMEVKEKYTKFLEDERKKKQRDKSLKNLGV